MVRGCSTSEASSVLSSSDTTTATAHADTASSSISRNLACSEIAGGGYYCPLATHLGAAATPLRLALVRGLACSEALACCFRSDAPKTAESSVVSLRWAATKVARAASREKWRSTWG